MSPQLQRGEIWWCEPPEIGHRPVPEISGEASGIICCMTMGTDLRDHARPSDPETIRFKGAGVTLVASAWGDPADPPIVFMHGGGQTRHAWGSTAADVAGQGWYAVTLDLRGHGESDWAPGGDYDMISFGADVSAVARSFNQPPVLVGASLGGMSTMLAVGEADKQEEIASAAVFVDVVPRLEQTGVERIGGFMREHIEKGFATLEDAAAVIAAYTPERKRAVNLESLEKNLRRGDDGRWRWHWDPAFMTMRPDANSGSALYMDRMLDAVRRITIPTLLVRGRMSDMVSPEGVAEFLEAVPHAKFVDVSDAGHMVAGDRNDVFSDAVIAFLADI